MFFLENRKQKIAEPYNYYSLKSFSIINLILLSETYSPDPITLRDVYYHIISYQSYVRLSVLHRNFTAIKYFLYNLNQLEHKY